MGKKRQKNDDRVPWWIVAMGFAASLPYGKLLLVVMAAPFVVVAWKQPAEFTKIVEAVVSSPLFAISGWVCFGGIAIALYVVYRASRETITRKARRVREMEEEKKPGSRLSSKNGGKK